MRQVIALEARLRQCRNVRTLGVKPNFCDYDAPCREAIRRSPTIYYPSRFYADLFDAAGKRIFPSRHTYHYAQDKIRQTALFQLLDIPHPATRVFYGRQRQQDILDSFRLPFVAKVPVGSAMGRGVFLIATPADLERYCQSCSKAYIQEYVPSRRTLRVVVIGERAVLAYWRIAAAGEFRCNLEAGARISFTDVPAPAVDLARNTARRCGWDDVGLDICEHAGRYWVLEANMKYGRAGFAAAGIEYPQLMERLIDSGRI